MVTLPWINGNDVPYVLVRGSQSGVWAGYLVARDGSIVDMRKARKIWFWAGAASLAQLAMEGTKDPANCRFPCEVDRVHTMDAVEILYCTDEAKKSIQGVPVWQAT